ncbi:MAG TPA: SurA N-terminal domain-containing protein [Rhizomicrobium sp.]
MIQWMHQLSKSWVATLLMGGLALSFMVWGIADVFTGQTSTALATVGSTEISTQEFSRLYRNTLRNEPNLTPELAAKMGVDQQLLQQQISQVALDNDTKRLDLSVSDAELAGQIRALPAFKGATGEFDHNMFLQIIGNAGYSEQEFLQAERTDQTRAQLTTALQAGFAMPENYSNGLATYLGERRAADFVIVSPDSVGAIAPPPDATLEAYVKAHADRFSTPEYREVEYAQVAPQDVTGQVNVTDKMIADEFKAHEANYNVPEKRDVQQIEFASETDAKAARDRIQSGTSFEAIAAERKIKPENLSIGTLAKTDMADQPRADAVFALPANEVSQPVKGALNGYVLVRVTKITPGVSRTLDDSKDQIRQQLALQLAGAKVTDIVNAYEDARSGGADIATAAKKVGMKAGRITAVDKNGLSPSGEKVAEVPTDPEFLSSAFAAEVGEDNDPFPGKASGAYYAVKVGGVTPAKLKPLDQVRADALAGWTDDEKKKAVAAKAATLAAQAQKDGNLAGIAKGLKVSVQQSPSLARNTDDTTFSTMLVTKLFQSEPGVVTEAPQGTGGNYIIARLTGIAHPPTPAEAALALRQQLSEQAAADFTISFANAARLRQGVKVNQKLLQQATGAGS